MRDLAGRVGTTRGTIRRFEVGENTPRAHTLDAIRAELETRGVRFTFRADGRPKGIEEAC
jgi:transcriptional regulator with XRE-family HTH domain